MSLSTILAVIDGAPGSEAALTAALDLGRTFAARVDLLHVEIDAASAMPLIGDGMSGAAIEQIMESLQADAKARLAAARELYERRCVAEKLPVVAPDSDPEAGTFAVSFNHVVGPEPETVLRNARLSDLTVIGRLGDKNDGGVSPTFETVLFDSGRPVLLVPSQPVKRLAETIAVAWDRSREAARAVSAALPLLRRAKRVLVMMAREPGRNAEPSELVRYLAGHGIAARTWAFVPETGSIGESLLGESTKAGADLLVMGGYGHSRLRELVLGGATRGVLTKAAIPVFMVH